MEPSVSLSKCGLAAVSVLASLGAAGTARATAYAYANVVFTDVTLGGLAADGVTIIGADVSTRSGASFPGFAPSGFSAGPKNPSAPLAEGSDALQAYSGPGPAPPENTYSQASLGGSGARGDTRIGPSFVAGRGTRTGDVAEARLDAAGVAASAAGTSTEFAIGVAPGRTAALTVTVGASVGLSATTVAAGEASSARVSARLAVVGIDGTAFAPLVLSPDVLNVSVSSADGGPDGTLSVGPISFGTSVMLGSGTYLLSLVSDAQVRLIGTAAPVLEPDSLAVLGGGLLGLGLGLVRRRKRA